VVKDQLHGTDYVKEEDPKYYFSQKTSRGPLNDNWIEEYWNECKVYDYEMKLDVKVFLLIFNHCGNNIEVNVVCVGAKNADVYWESNNVCLQVMSCGISLLGNAK
jgi:hypothetical protein